MRDDNSIVDVAVSETEVVPWIRNVAPDMVSVVSLRESVTNLSDVDIDTDFDIDRFVEDTVVMTSFNGVELVDDFSCSIMCSGEVVIGTLSPEFKLYFRFLFSFSLLISPTFALTASSNFPSLILWLFCCQICAT